MSVDEAEGHQITGVVGRSGGTHSPTAMQKLRIERLGFGTARQKMALNDLQQPNFRGVRVALGTRYNPGEGNRRASRNGRVSDLPPEILPVRFATFASLYPLPLFLWVSPSPASSNLARPLSFTHPLSITRPQTAEARG